jgi:hypothetical protein
MYGVLAGGDVEVMMRTLSMMLYAWILRMVG